jgi:polar amino acid transport system substrate-binding protein
MKIFLTAAVLTVSALAATRIVAETCGGQYVVQRGDSLSTISDTLYKDAGKWTLIHNGNLKTIGSKPNSLRVGMVLELTCIEGLPIGLQGGREATGDAIAEALPMTIEPGNAAVRNKINLLTADDYAPFTSKSSHNGGLLTEIVDKAMAKAAPKEGYAIHWVNDWSSHFDPLLSNALLDMGFPWYLPDCKITPENERCADFLASDAMFETLMLLFVDKSRPFTFDTDGDIIGKTLCRPAGYLTFDLDQGGRRWMLDNKITLKQPRSIKECYDMVLAGEADAVALSEFIGRAALKNNNYQDRFDVLPQPLSILGLHVFVHKSHPRAQELLDTINGGLKGIRDDGTYQAIIEDQMARIWADF